MSDGMLHVPARQVALFTSQSHSNGHLPLELPPKPSLTADDGSEEGASTSKYSSNALKVNIELS